MNLSLLFSSWKQPIPTNLDEYFGQDYLSQEIFVFVLLHATNEERVVNRNGKFTTLHRGQCYATITDLAKRFNRDRETISNALERLATFFNALHSERDHFGIVLTIKSYDEIIGFHSETSNESTTTPQLPITNNNVNNERKEKSTEEGLTSISDDVRQVFTHYLSISKTQEKLLPSRKKKIQARLKTFTVDEIKTAIDNCFADGFFNGTTNAKGWRANADYLFKSDEVIDKHLNKTPKPVETTSNVNTADKGQDGMSLEEVKEAIRKQNEERSIYESS